MCREVKDWELKEVHGIEVSVSVKLMQMLLAVDRGGIMSLKEGKVYLEQS